MAHCDALTYLIKALFIYALAEKAVLPTRVIPRMVAHCQQPTIFKNCLETPVQAPVAVEYARPVPEWME